MSKKPVLTLIVLVTIMGLLSACNAGQTESPVDSPPVDTQTQPTTPPKTPTATPVPLTRPTAAKYHLVYDPNIKQILLIGFLYTNPDVWAYDVASQTLTRKKDKPATSIQCLDYNTTAGGVVTTNQYTSATWLYDPEKETWIELAAGPLYTAPSGNPLPCSFVYDSESARQVTVIWDVKNSSSTLVYDYASNSWTYELANPRPLAVEGDSMVYDAESDRILFWNVGTGKSMWAYDTNTNTWEEIAYTGGPSKFGPLWAAVYVPDLDRSFFYYLDYFYAYDYNSNSWEQAKGELKPGSRIMHSMAYDPVAKKIVMYGGMDENGTKFFDDLWLYDPQTGEWTEQPLP